MTGKPQSDPQLIAEEYAHFRWCGLDHHETVHYLALAFDHHEITITKKLAAARRQEAPA